MDFYTCFNKELPSIDELIIGGETIRAFLKAFGPKGTALYDRLSIIPINNIDK